jgi:hypothetical protein
VVLQLLLHQLNKQVPPSSTCKQGLGMLENFQHPAKGASAMPISPWHLLNESLHGVVYVLQCGWIVVKDTTSLLTTLGKVASSQYAQHS